MSKIKFEFLAQYHAKNGTPLRSRLFADIARLARMGSGFAAPIANTMLGSGLMRRALDAWVGISCERTLPSFSRTPFTTWFKRRLPRTGSLGQVVLFNDTFNTYHEPEVAIAATEVLEAAGFEVLLPGHKCCGRPMISKGLVKKARAAARDTVARLAPFAEAGLPIIGLEPSCLFSLRDEYLYLLPGDAQAQRVAKQAVLFEEFIARLSGEGRLALSFTREVRDLLLHGHCHQRAFIGTKPTLEVLSLPENYAVREVDSSCCGMAGSFGYEKEHYQLSCTMAERRLLPEVRAASDATLVVAPGTSCRHQIEHGSMRRVLHPAEVLRGALV